MEKKTKKIRADKLTLPSPNHQFKDDNDRANYLRRLCIIAQKEYEIERPGKTRKEALKRYGNVRYFYRAILKKEITDAESRLDIIKQCKTPAEMDEVIKNGRQEAAIKKEKIRADKLTLLSPNHQFNDDDDRVNYLRRLYSIAQKEYEIARPGKTKKEALRRCGNINYFYIALQEKVVVKDAKSRLDIIKQCKTPAEMDEVIKNGRQEAAIKKEKIRADKLTLLSPNHQFNDENEKIDYLRKLHIVTYKEWQTKRPGKTKKEALRRYGNVRYFYRALPQKVVVKDAKSRLDIIKQCKTPAEMDEVIKNGLYKTKEEIDVMLAKLRQLPPQDKPTTECKDSAEMDEVIKNGLYKTKEEIDVMLAKLRQLPPQDKPTTECKDSAEMEDVIVSERGKFKTGKDGVKISKNNESQCQYLIEDEKEETKKLDKAEQVFNLTAKRKPKKRNIEPEAPEIVKKHQKEDVLEAPWPKIVKPVPVRQQGLYLPHVAGKVQKENKKDDSIDVKIEPEAPPIQKQHQKEDVLEAPWPKIVKPVPVRQQGSPNVKEAKKKDDPIVVKMEEELNTNPSPGNIANLKGISNGDNISK